MKIQCLLPILFVLMAGSVKAADSLRANSIGYASVAEALADLESNPAAEIKEQDGWTIVSVQTGDERSIWSFTPPEHAAHPAAVKRTIYEQDGAVRMRTNALCQASKTECDKLMEQFAELEQKIREHMQGARGGT